MLALLSKVVSNGYEENIAEETYIKFSFISLIVDAWPM
jgi:hypothetical protein